MGRGATGPDDWAAALDAPDPGTPHNEAREQVWDALLEILLDKHDDEADVDIDVLRAALDHDEDLRATFNRAWPLIDATDLVGDLWSVPAYLRMCAPWLRPEEVRLLQRTEPAAWTVADLPLLDAARHRLGDPDAPARARRRRAVAAAEREQVAAVIDDLIAADDDHEGLVTMLRHPDIRSNLADPDAVPLADPDLLAGPFAHVVVDEAQELTDAEWQMVLRRCPSRSLTIVGDRAQARQGFPESWEERLGRVGLDRTTHRLPPHQLPHADGGHDRGGARHPGRAPGRQRPDVDPQHGHPRDPRVGVRRPVGPRQVAGCARRGSACLIGDPTTPVTPRVRSLTPELAKGLEFDLVVLVDPESFGSGLTGAVDRYVSMTRATQQLVVLTTP